MLFRSYNAIGLQQIRCVIVFHRPCTNPKTTNSKYAAIEQCRWEVDAAEKLFRREAIPSVSSTHTSIEEIASKILQALGLNRQLY